MVAGPEKKRIKVSSHILRNASRNYNTYIGARFSEDQDLGDDTPKEVYMPIENATALEIICNVIHHRNEAVPVHLPPEKVFEVMGVAERLVCTESLMFISTLWLEPGDLTGIKELSYLMVSAFMVDDARAFSKITRAMILHVKNSFLTAAEDDLATAAAGEPVRVMDDIPQAILRKRKLPDILNLLMR